MRIAVIGGGAAGLMSAWLLQAEHQVTLYESADVAGGHARTIPIEIDGVTVYCETGFKYFFRVNYSHLMALLRVLELPVRSHRHSMTIVLRDGRGTMVLPPRTFRQVLGLLTSPGELWSLVRYERFMRSGRALIARQDWSISLREYVRRQGLPESWARDIVYPTLAANWGAPEEELPDFPAYSVIKVLCRNKGQSNWFYELDGGISRYIGALVRELEAVDLRLGCGAAHLRREGEQLIVEDTRGGSNAYDQVVFATSARDAARLATGLSGAEEWARLLGSFRHFDTSVALHGDVRFMPARREDWSIINVFHGDGHAWQSEWCGWREKAPVFRTWLPPGSPIPEPLYQRLEYHHLIVTSENFALQRRLASMQGRQGLWAAGMYATDVDIHESSLMSAVQVGRALSPGSPNLARLERALQG